MAPKNSRAESPIHTAGIDPSSSNCGKRARILPHMTTFLAVTNDGRRIMRTYYSDGGRNIINKFMTSTDRVRIDAT